MQSALYYFNLNGIFLDLTVEWQAVESILAPTPGLFDYGMSITPLGKLAIYGGLTNVLGNVNTLRNRTFLSYNDFWVIDLASSNHSGFAVYNWSIGGIGGFSRIINLDGENICVLNENIPQKMVIVDLVSMSSYPLYLADFPNNFQMSGFGIAALNSSDFVVYGGYNSYGNEIKSLTASTLFSRLSFSTEKFVTSSEITETTKMVSIVISFAVLAICLVLFIFYKKQSILSAKINEKRKIRRNQELDDINEFLEKARTIFENKIKNLPNDPDYTQTIVIPNYGGIYIPAFRERTMGQDFRIERLIAEGGMGSVFVGVMLKAEDLNQYKEINGNIIIKTSKKEIPRNRFIQEVCIHEAFRDIKYFAQLIFYSENPQSIVLKYYQMGSLRDLIFGGKKLTYDFEYSFAAVFNIAYKMVWAFRLMHSKEIVHCDIKPDNILLDSDKEESIFPVITDFGISFILGTAEHVSGIDIANILGATKYYSPPEVLKNFLEKKICVAAKESDIFSIGLICLELFSRKPAWNPFDETYVISGGQPSHTANDIMGYAQTRQILYKLIMQCFKKDLKERPTSDQLYQGLFEINNSFQSNA